MRRRAIFMDIDGTLMCGGEEPSPNVIRQLRQARAAGHMCFLCTGRSRAYIPPALLRADYLDGYVAGTGTYAKVGEKVIYCQRIPREALRAACGVLMGIGRMFLVEGEDAIWGYRDPNAQFPILSVDDFDVRYPGAALTKLTVDGQMTREIRVAMSPWFTFYEMDTYFEAILHGNSKATGMEKVLSYVGISREDSVGIGDSQNDIAMLKYAGLGIAMGNADEETKASADCETKSFAQDGVAWAIRQYVMEEK